MDDDRYVQCIGKMVAIDGFNKSSFMGTRVTEVIQEYLKSE